MKVALATGVLNAGVWLTWVITHWRPHCHKAFVFFVLLHVFAVFEVTSHCTNPRLCVCVYVGMSVCLSIPSCSSVFVCRSVTQVSLCSRLLLHGQVFDFPPWRNLIDAHAVWHAGTIPLAYLWYSFLTDDAAYELNARSKRP
jgi:hypothetical protein